MNERKDGGPANPVGGTTCPSGDFYPDSPGMSVRQWYKGAALKRASALGGPHAVDVAEWAGQIADAMIAEDEAFAAQAEGDFIQEYPSPGTEPRPSSGGMVEPFPPSISAGIYARLPATDAARYQWAETKNRYELIGVDEENTS